MQLTVYTDGGSRGNPGVSGGGVVVLGGKGEELYSESFSFGIKTNNEAEYLAVLRALQWLKTAGLNEPVSKVQFILDSKLVVEQLSQNWKIREPRLKELAADCWAHLRTLPFPTQFSHVKRHQNVRADLLANQAMDAASE